MKNLLILFLVFLAVLGYGDTTTNLAGQWKVHNSIAGNESDQDCKFEQTENTLSGSCKSEDKEVQITGRIDGKNVTWKFDTEYNGTAITLTYTATLDDASKIAGSVEVEPYGVTGEFTATAAKPAK